MQRAGESRGEAGDAPLAVDLQRLIRQVATWAAARPIILDVALFGDRIQSGRNHCALELAVRFDETRMIDGFDDWIEQLRTGFSELETLLAEKVIVITPDNAGCSSVFAGRELQALASGKVRVMMELRERPQECRDAALHNQHGPRTRRSSILSAALDWILLRSAGAH